MRYRAWARLELKRDDMHANRLEQVFADQLADPLMRFDAAWVHQWWQERLTTPTHKTGMPPTRATAARDLACLRAALSRAVEWGLLATNPLLGIRFKGAQSRRVVRYLSPDEEQRLRVVMANRDRYMIQARQSGNRWRVLRAEPQYPDIPTDTFGDHLSPIVLLAMNTEMRRGEILSLTWGDVDLTGRMLMIRAVNAKSRRERHIPLNAEALDVLQRWSVCRGGVQSGRLFAVGDIKTAWVRLLSDARVEQVRFHDLRHNFASRLVRAGVDLNTVRDLRRSCGHQDDAAIRALSPGWVGGGSRRVGFLITTLKYRGRMSDVSEKVALGVARCACESPRLL